MPRKSSRRRKPTSPERTSTQDQHHEEDGIYFRARAFHRAANILVKTMEGGKVPRIEGDSLPILFLYRQAAELHLKALILGYGRNFLPVKPVPARIQGTGSLRILVALVSRILEAIGWYRGFKPEGVADLCDLRAVISRLEGFDISLRPLRRGEGKRTIVGSVPVNIPDFARQVDAVLNILHAAADGLAAMRDTGGPIRNSGLEVGDEPVQ